MVALFALWFSGMLLAGLRLCCGRTVKWWACHGEGVRVCGTQSLAAYVVGQGCGARAPVEADIQGD